MPPPQQTWWKTSEKISFAVQKYPPIWLGQSIFIYTTIKMISFIMPSFFHSTITNSTVNTAVTFLNVDDQLFQFQQRLGCDFELLCTVMYLSLLLSFVVSHCIFCITHIGKTNVRKSPANKHPAGVWGISIKQVSGVRVPVPGVTWNGF